MKNTIGARHFSSVDFSTFSLPTWCFRTFLTILGSFVQLFYKLPYNLGFYCIVCVQLECFLGLILLMDQLQAERRGRLRMRKEMYKEVNRRWACHISSKALDCDSLALSPFFGRVAMRCFFFFPFLFL